MNVIVFDAKPYDQKFFERANETFGHTITYAKYRLSPENAVTAQGHDVVCAFVNDDLGQDTIEQLIKAGVKLVALRCAGYNNVHLAACHGSLHEAALLTRHPTSDAARDIEALAARLVDTI